MHDDPEDHPGRERSLQATRARELRNNATPAERFLWTYLRRKQLKGLKFRRQSPFGSYIADFVCLSARLIVELDGSHHAEPAQMSHDRIRTVWLKGQDFCVVRFRNEEVLRDVEAVLAIIAHEVGFRRAVDPAGRVADPAPSPPPARGGGIPSD